MKIKIGSDVQLWNGSKGEITNFTLGNHKFELSVGGHSVDWYHVMDIKILNGVEFFDWNNVEFEIPEPETLMDKYSRLIIKANNLSLNQFLFIHENKYYIVFWQKGKWSNPTTTHLFE